MSIRNIVFACISHIPYEINNQMENCSLMYYMALILYQSSHNKMNVYSLSDEYQAHC